MKSGTVTLGFIHPGQLSAVFVKSKTDMFFHDLANEQRFFGPSHKPEIGIEVHAAAIHRGRNDIVTAFLDAGESEWLVFIDADMGFDADSVDRLIRSADKYMRPIVGALCFGHNLDGRGPHGARRFRIQPTLFRMAQTDDEMGFIPWFDYPRDRVVEVDATGGAFVLIHRSVLEKLRSEHGDRWYSHIEVPESTNRFTEFSEDISFCLRAKAAGFPIHVHTGVRTTHDKGDIFLDEEVFDVQQHYRQLIGAKADPL